MALSLINFYNLYLKIDLSFYVFIFKILTKKNSNINTLVNNSNTFDRYILKKCSSPAQFSIFLYYFVIQCFRDNVIYILAASCSFIQFSFVNPKLTDRKLVCMLCVSVHVIILPSDSAYKPLPLQPLLSLYMKLTVYTSDSEEYSR